MAERSCSGTIGLEEGVRSSSCLQGNEITRCESVLNGPDRCNLERKLHESLFENGFVEQEQRFASRGAGIYSHHHNDHGIGVARLGKKLDNPETGIWRLDDFVLAAICYADDVVLAAASVAAAEVMVAEVIAMLKDVGLTVGWCTENTLHEPPEDCWQKHCGGRTGCVV